MQVEWLIEKLQEMPPNFKVVINDAEDENEVYNVMDFPQQGSVVLSIDIPRIEELEIQVEELETERDDISEELEEKLIEIDDLKYVANQKEDSNE